jgi:hypothetical protein
VARHTSHYPEVRRVAGILGIAGPVVFTLAWLTGWAAQTEYSPRREDLSALAALDAQHAGIMIAGFVLLGLCVMALAAGMIGALTASRSATVAPLILLLVGGGIAASGLMRNDCSSELDSCAARISTGDVSWHHNGHDVTSISVFVLFIVVQVVFARAARTDADWASLRPYYLVSATLMAALLVLYGSEALGSWNGLVQRVFVAVPLLWVAVTGARLAQTSAAGSTAFSRSRGRPRAKGTDTRVIQPGSGRTPGHSQDAAPLVMGRTSVIHSSERNDVPAPTGRQ